MTDNRYIKVVQFLDGSMLGIIIGIITSVIVNIITSVAMTLLIFFNIGLDLIAICCVVVLIKIRQDVDKSYASAKPGTKEEDKWNNAIDPELKKGKTKRKTTFVAALYIGLGLFMLSLFLMILENYKAAHLQAAPAEVKAELIAKPEIGQHTFKPVKENKDTAVGMKKKEN